MPEITRRIVFNINAILDGRGLTQTWLANKIGKKQPQLSRYLSGAAELPNDWAEAIAGALDESLEKLLGLPAQPDRDASLMRLSCVSAILEADASHLGPVLDLLLKLPKAASNQRKGRSSG